MLGLSERKVFSTEPIELDFEGVLSVGPSWLDEVLSALRSEYGGKRVRCLPTSNPSVVESLKVIHPGEVFGGMQMFPRKGRQKNFFAPQKRDGLGRGPGGLLRFHVLYLSVGAAGTGKLARRKAWISSAVF